MTKLIIQIPCLNEAETLPATLAELPRSVPGIDVVEWLVIDDGSTDNTATVARQHGVDHVVTHAINRGLAAAFQSGIDACIQLGADVIVNTDADNQYPAQYIPDLVKPIIDGKADLVVSDRQVAKVPHFSPMKKRFQYLGSWVVRYISGTRVPDAPSGFRAFTRQAALKFNVISGYTYTLETLIQAGKKNMTVTSVPIHVNAHTRPSRLMRNPVEYVFRSMVTLLRLFLMYEPLRSFAYLSLPFLFAGLGLWLYYIILVISGIAGSGSNVQSVVVGGALLMIAVLLQSIGLLGEVVAMNRRLQEETLFYLKRLSLSPQNEMLNHPHEEQT